MKRLSDLEMAILGIVWKRAPCTTYAVAREFATSPSSHWRGSAGAVYPAIDRLCRLRLVKQRKGVSLGRPCSLLALTAKGLAQLQKWLTPPLDGAAATITHDPVRTRTFFLAALAPEQQRAFLEDAESQLVAQLPVLEEEVARYRRSGDWFSEQAQKGALHTMIARLAWLREFRAALDQRLNESVSKKERRK
jgi:DNA-binding PadR family transcriptional regulator